MKKVLILFIAFMSLVSADEIVSPKTVKKWLASEDDKIEKVTKLTPIIFVNGEKGFVAGLEFKDAPRNGWAGYALVRPKFKQARKVVKENIGGQYNAISVVFQGYGDKPSIVELGGAGSGQGYLNENRMWVSFDGWQLITRYAVETLSDNSGACGEDLNPCEETQVFLNFIDINPLTIAKTTVNRKGKTLENMKSIIKAEIITPEK